MKVVPNCEGYLLINIFEFESNFTSKKKKGHHLYPKNLEQVIVYYGKYGKKIAIAIATKYS